MNSLYYDGWTGGWKVYNIFPTRVVVMLKVMLNSVKAHVIQIKVFNTKPKKGLDTCSVEWKLHQGSCIIVN